MSTYNISGRRKQGGDDLAASVMEQYRAEHQAELFEYRIIKGEDCLLCAGFHREAIESPLTGSSAQMNFYPIGIGKGRPVHSWRVRRPLAN